MNKQVKLSTDEALILQQILEDGEDDIRSLALSFGMSRDYVIRILSNLKHKGLVVINNTCGDLWARVTTKGKRFVSSIWPEANYSFSL